MIVSWLENKNEREIQRYYSSRVLPNLPVNTAFLIALFFERKKKEKKKRNSQSTPEWRLLLVTRNPSFRRLCLLNSCACRVRKFPSPNCNSTTSCRSSKHRSRVKISVPLFEKTFRNSNRLETKSSERISMWESFWYFVCERTRKREKRTVRGRARVFRQYLGCHLGITSFTGCPLLVIRIRLVQD